MKLQIFMTPADVLTVKPAASDIYIVIDLIRATTAITTIFDQGAASVFAAESVEQARTAAHTIPGRLLCGERNALPLPGFDYGNSPAQFAHTDLTNRELILTTTNGTRAFFSCPEHSIRLAGCFYNAHAVTSYAIEQAHKKESNINIVCAGEAGSFALDDTVCAGYLADQIRRLYPAIEYHESVTAASGLHQLYPPPQLADLCHSAQQVIQAGLREDIDYCMRKNVSTSIAYVAGQEVDTGLLILKKL